ncbi:RrF2 family transcriptional regulator [Saccharicrinis aurantiacus]|uniref:RrF2 family transcriptional regulator n=1 Tax=Saccharicrinis aurantiacus TaxID=1849719 RepID=UPI00094FCAE0|nr:Rrf2 family transcriptional regulator [Saccharicrinis aurantiacus]
MSKIFTLSEASSIAIHGMVLIAKSDVKLNVNQIAEKIDSSKHHVAKVFQRLAKENLVSSNRGPSGGFILKKDPEEISLLDIYEVIEGKIEIEGCMQDKEECAFDSCILGNISNDLACRFRAYLKDKFLINYLDKAYN